jgi:hypothetical protein
MIHDKTRRAFISRANIIEEGSSDVALVINIRSKGRKVKGKSRTMSARDLRGEQCQP